MRAMGVLAGLLGSCRRGASTLALLVSASGGCIVDDGRCSAHQVADADFATSVNQCVCEDGYILSSKGYGCEPCGMHEEVVNGKCECEAGYARESDTAACEEIRGSLAGTACSESQPCSDPNPYCVATTDAGFCTTRGCTRNDDCPANWRCETSESDSYCAMPPDRLGEACESSSDCSADGAAYCETLMAHVCLVKDCARHPAQCPSASVCCDLSAFIDTSLCLPKSTLVDGKCIDGMSPVTP